MPTEQGETGWGHEHQAWRKSLAIERLEADRNCQLYGEARYSAPVESTGIKEEYSHIYELIQSQLPWDDGSWDFTVAERLVYGEVLQRGPQAVGNCVGYSHCLLLAARLAHEILFGDLEDELGTLTDNSPIPYIPYSYGAGRCLASSQLCGRGDGSYCSIQLRASAEHGFLPSDTEGLPGTSPEGSGQVCREWGSSKEILLEWRPKALLFDLEHSYQVRSSDDLAKAVLEDFMPAQICSSWGFAPDYQITGDGVNFWVYKNRGSWSHSMQILACFKYKGLRYFKIGNQWGSNAHKDGYFFCVNDETMDKWLKSADCRTIGEIKGRPVPVNLSVV